MHELFLTKHSSRGLDEITTGDPAAHEDINDTLHALAENPFMDGPSVAMKRTGSVWCPVGLQSALRIVVSCMCGGCRDEVRDGADWGDRWAAPDFSARAWRTH